ncbi:MAG: hypothetical protein KJ737_11395 [Proteobacteria bacterium]|nr:hypothetical protein [Pseudomonadota bacterium]
MQYLEKLMDQFSDTPRNIILHADVCRRGIKITEDLKNAAPNTCVTGITNKLQETVLEQIPIPNQFIFKADETTVDIKIDGKSPYEINKDGEGKYSLFCGGQNMGAVKFIKRPSYIDKQTSDGKDVANMIMQRGPFCLLVSPLDFCAYMRKDEACKYCLLSAAMEVAIEKKLIEAIPDYNVLAEAVSLACEDINLKDLKICGGALYNTSKEASYYKKCIEAILNRIDKPEELTVFSQAFEKEDQKDLQKLGVQNVLFNLEVWNEGLWPELLPGKTKAIGRKEWIKRLEDAVDVFGRGHVGTSFVAGFECAPRKGFLSQDEALKSYIEGFEFLIKRGIVPWFTVWTASPLVGGFSENDPPPTEFYLRLGETVHELLGKYGVYPDLGFNEMGVDPPTLGLYCNYCYSMSFTRDYPRLIGRNGKNG